MPANAQPDRRLSERTPKKLTRPLIGWFQGITRNPPGEWAELELCRWLNHNLGTTIKPWEMGGVPDLWLSFIITGLNLEAQLRERN